LSDYEIRERVAFNLQETVLQDEGSREPPHHFSLSWDGAKKHSTIVVLDDAATKTALKKAKKKKLPGGEFSYLTYTSEHSGMPIPILALDVDKPPEIVFYANDTPDTLRMSSRYA
jgi:hypothetical protein